MINVLLLLWHPADAVAGGFIRIQKFLPYLENLNITVVDRNKSIASDFIKQGEIIEYTIPSWIISIYNYSFTLGRLLEWIYALNALVSIGSKKLKDSTFHIIYGPTGDNLHIFLAGVILKKRFPQVKLLLDVLNLEMPEGTFKTNFISSYNNGLGIFRSFILSIGMVFLLSIERKLISYCDFVVTVSPYMKRIIAKYYPKNKIDFTPSGVTLPNKKVAKTFNNKIKAVYVGRHTPEKGVFDLIKVWEEIYKINKDAQLVMMGFCEPYIKEKLQAEINKLGLKKNIKILGTVPLEVKEKQLASANIFLHLAYYEPLVPVITILEALAFGNPVITYDCDSMNDYPYLKNNKALYIIPNKNIKMASEAICRHMSKSISERKEISLLAQKLVKEFSWEQITNKELEIIKSLVKIK